MSGPIDVAVIVPAFNGETYVAEAIESVLGQTLRPAEVVVVDDGSTDRTAAVAAAVSEEVTVVTQPNGGPAAALNRGVDQTRAGYVAFISADDRWAPDKLERQAAVVLDAGVDLVFGHVQHFLSPDLDPDLAARLRCPPDPMPANSAGTMLASRAVFDVVGRFDEQYRTGEFIDWFSRAQDHGLRSQILTEVVSFRRVHATNHSRTQDAPRASYARVLRAAIERRKGLETDPP